MERVACAVDLGGSHGRAVLGSYDGTRINLKEAGTFECPICEREGLLCWDAPAIFERAVAALETAARVAPGRLESVGLDSMGNNSVLLDERGELVTPPPYTRVPQRRDVMDYVFSRFPPETLYAETGLQVKKLNALYTVALFLMERPDDLGRAKRFLMLNDWLNYALSGFVGSEYTIASTSDLLSARNGDWSDTLINALGLNRGLFPPIVATGTALGPIGAGKALRGTPLIAVPGHDTACAALCASPSDAFVSLGTWVMVGCYEAEPLLNERAMRAGFANEGAAYGGIRFIHNSVGLSILNQCLKKWNETAKLTLHEALMLAEQARPDCGRIDLSDPDFLVPDDMPASILAHCRRAGRQAPRDIGETARCVLESLAEHIARTLEKMRDLTGRRFETVRVLGGASANAWLMQRIADCSGRVVKAGPSEAAALGSLLSQWIALGVFSDVHQARSALDASFPPTIYRPGAGS